MTSSLITWDNLSHVTQFVPKTSSVVVLTVSVLTPATKQTENITLKELKINWGELSLVRQGIGTFKSRRFYNALCYSVSHVQYNM